MKRLFLLLLFASCGAMAFGDSSTNEQGQGQLQGQGQNQGQKAYGGHSNAGAISGSSANNHVSTKSQNSLAGGNTSSQGGDANSGSSSNSEGGNGIVAVGGDVEIHDYKEIPVAGSFTVPAICTQSTAASGLKLSVSSSETVAACLRISTAIAQFEMASRLECVDSNSDCVGSRNLMIMNATATLEDVGQRLESQADGDRTYQQASRWFSLGGLLSVVAMAL